jgi:hypothetical protein
MQSPDIAVVYNEHLPGDLFRDLANEIGDERLSLVIESRPDDGPYGCPEWFILTAAAIYVGKSYFDGFLKEAGKDHYQALNAGLGRLAARLMSNPDIEPLVIGTTGKVSPKNPYSLAFSVYAEAQDGYRLKLLFPKPDEANDYEEIVAGFLEFLRALHAGKKSLADIGFDFTSRPPGSHIFVRLNKETKEIEWLDVRDYR